jgi:hypothetical protein
MSRTTSIQEETDHVHNYLVPGGEDKRTEKHKRSPSTIQLKLEVVLVGLLVLLERPAAFFSGNRKSGKR